MSSPDDMTALRAEIFGALRGLKAGTVTLDQARGINELAKTLVDTAKVEVDYLKVTEGEASNFIAGGDGPEALPPGITGIRRHRLEG